VKRTRGVAPPQGALVRRRSGRPSREDAIRLRQTIIDVARRLFLEQGYGSTSIDQIALLAHISKRTLYHRFQDKAALFAVVVGDIVTRLRPPGAADTDALAKLASGPDIAVILHRLAQLALAAALTPEALALTRLLIAEAIRFPELARAAEAEGSRREGIVLIAALLDRETKAGRIAVTKPDFAAEQFLQMVVSVPIRRAMGLGLPMSAAECETWIDDTVALFLQGCAAGLTKLKDK